MPRAKVTESRTTETIRIYLGPVINGVALPGMIFKNGLTPKMEEVTREIPAIKELLVEPERLVQARKNLQNETSAIRACYKKVAEYAAGRKYL